MNEDTPAGAATGCGEVDDDRRAFLGKAVGVVPPAMVMLLSTSMSSPAIAASNASAAQSASGDEMLEVLGGLFRIGGDG